MKYNVFDKDHNYLGVIHGDNEEQALEEAKFFDMKTAHHCDVRVEERDKIIYPRGGGTFK